MKLGGDWCASLPSPSLILAMIAAAAPRLLIPILVFACRVVMHGRQWLTDSREARMCVDPSSAREGATCGLQIGMSSLASFVRLQRLI